MPCTPFRDENGKVIAIVCTRGERRRRCKVPGCNRWASKLCDFPVKRKQSGTCDMAICEYHATQVGDDLDHCPAHAKAHQQQELF
jgi:hypothetical protein